MKTVKQRRKYFRIGDVNKVRGQASMDITKSLEEGERNYLNIEYIILQINDLFPKDIRINHN